MPTTIFTTTQKMNFISSKLTFLLLFLPCFTYGQWGQVGSEMNGSAAGDGFGRSVSMNATGSVLAVGTDRDSGSFTAYTRIFEWDGTDWAQKGEDIAGIGAIDLNGEYVCLNDSGNIVAIRARGVNNFAGAARIFEWNGSAWVQLGTDIIGDSLDAGLGGAISLNGTGHTVVVGACSNDGNGNNAGNARIYDWDGTTWVQRGFNIDGEDALDQAGGALSISASGDRIAVASKINAANGSGLGTGHVRVFDWNGTAWVQLGNEINGTLQYQFFGSFVRLNDAGSVLAIGATQSDSATYDGFVQVYEWNGTAWVQRGADLRAETTGIESAAIIDLNAAGSIIAIGAPTNSGNAYWSGHVRLFIWDGSIWDQIGADIDGETEQDFLGSDVSLTADGTTVAIGISGNDDNGTTAGQVRVFKYAVPASIVKTEAVNYSLYPNPTNSMVHISLSETVESIALYSIYGVELLHEEKSLSSVDLDLTQFAAGQYMLTFKTKLGFYTEKVIKF